MRFSTLLAGVLAPLALLASACDVGVDGELDVEVEAPDGGLAPDADLLDPDLPETDPSAGNVVTVIAPGGVRRMRYVERDGLAMAEGDIVLGAIDEVRKLRANVTFSDHWPEGVVPYAIDDSVSSALRANIAFAMWDIQALTPVRFVQADDSCVDPFNLFCDDIVVFVQEDLDGVAGSSAVGRQGGRQKIRLKADAGKGVALHEMLHSLGFHHEHTRPDRRFFVEYHPECVQSEHRHNFDVEDDAEGYRDYDFASVMQYQSVSSINVSDDCLSLIRLSGPSPCPSCYDADGDGFDEAIGWHGDKLSAGDVNALWAMYGDAVDANEYGDMFGGAVATGDFNGDGYDDLAVGTPGEDIGTAYDTGNVQLFRGTGGDLEPWLALDQADGGAAVESYDRFGSALAVGDLNGDGYADLAVGIPNEGVGSIRAGAVIVFTGSPTGLHALQIVTQTELGSMNEAGDMLGAALVFGDFDGDGDDDLAIGAPGEAPGADPKSGYVFVMRSDGTRLQKWTAVQQRTSFVVPPYGAMGQNEHNERFGSALAAGDLDGDGDEELAVGAPCDSHDVACAGGVYVYRFQGNGMYGTDRLQQNPLGANETDDQFGYALAIGDINGLAGNELVIGAPGEDYGSKRDVGYVFAFSHDGTRMVARHGISQAGLSDDGAGDRFGAAIATNGTDHWGRMIVGAPDEQWGTGPVSGAAFVFGPTDTGMVSPLFLLGQSPVETDEANDSLGYAVAVLHITGSGWIASAPFEDYAKGAVIRYNGTIGRATQRIGQSDHPSLKN